MSAFWENIGKRMDQIGSNLEKAVENSEPDTKTKTPKKLTWEEFVNKTEKDLDKRLIEHAKKEGLVYVGGKGRFTVTKEKDKNDEFIMNVDVELYYKDQFKADKNFQIYPLHTERKFEDFVLDDEETKTQLEKLKSEQYEFNVETPQIKSDEE